MPDEFDLESELSDEMDALETAREAVAGDPNVGYVSLGATADDGDDLDNAIWVRTDGTVEGLDELRDDLDLPVEIIDERDHGAGMSRPVTEEAANDLQKRVETPVAGYEISPDLDLKNSGGTLGMVGVKPGSTTPVGNRKLVTAAHVFAVWDEKKKEYVYAPDVRQPASDRKKDVVGRNPVKPITRLDIIGYSLDDKARKWPNQSQVADIGTKPITGVKLPRNGMRVSKVGRTTEVTTGKIVDHNEVFFRVEPEGSNESLSQPGDSGAPWVTVTHDDELKWVGINIRGGTAKGTKTGKKTYRAAGIRADIVTGALEFDLL